MRRTPSCRACMPPARCACVSVHGANRLGTNSLLDLIVFGKHAGLQRRRICQWAPVSSRCPPTPPTLPASSSTPCCNSSGAEKACDIAAEMKTVMFDHVGVFRTEEGMQHALEKVRELQRALPARAHRRPAARSSTPSC